MNDSPLRTAFQLHQAGDLEKAALLYGDIIRAEAGNFPARFLLGLIHFQCGNYVEAERLMTEAIRINPLSHDALYNRGLILMKLRRPADAVVSFDSALRGDPNFAGALRGRGCALMELEQHDDALASFDRALALKPDSVQTLLARSQMLSKLDRNDEALRDAESYERLIFIERHGYAPDFRKPRSFSEKVVHRKLFDRNPAYSLLADKWRVREYVAARAGTDVLNPVFCVTSDPREIPFARMPDKFVLKATHGSGWNIFVHNKAELDIKATKRACRRYLARTFGAEENEHYYRAIRPQIIAESFLADGHGVLPLDYKCYVFHGRCHYIQVHFGRLLEHTSRIFDRAWKPLDVTLKFPLGPIIEPPDNLPEIIGVAEKLAAGFDFLRVDLYSIGGKRVVFGEITITPGAGHERFGPDAAFDFQLGALW